MTMTATFETAKVGDRVFSHTFGWGEICVIDKDNNYPIQILFAKCSESFTREGFYYKDNPVQSLFWNECTIDTPAKPLPMKLIHGVEVPDISFHPTNQTGYYYPYPTGEDLVYFTVYDDAYSVDKFRSDNNLCYPYTEEGKQAAILHAKAMLDIPV
jgi:hypothetical protein